MSEPLDHLLSVDLGESSPLCDVFEDENRRRVLSKLKKPVKKVRFADTNFCPVENVFTKLIGLNEPEEISSSSNTKEVKGILKVIKNSNFGGHEIVKGWSKPSLAVPLTVKILSSADSGTESTDVLESFIGSTSDENFQSVAEMDEDSVASQDANLIADENSNSSELSEQVGAYENDQSSLSCVEYESQNIEYDNVLKKGNDFDLPSAELGILQVDAEKFKDVLNCNVSGHGESTEHDFEQGKHLLEDEIRKISKELFVETASHMEDTKSDDGSVKSEISLDRSFISTEIVNDILDAQSGREKVLQDVGKPVKIEGTSCQTEKNLLSGDITQSRESLLGAKFVPSSRLKRPPSPHTQKLKRALEEIVPQKPTAKDLRTIAYNAWCTIKVNEKKLLVKKLKNAEKQTQELLMKEKSLKEASAIKAFLCWKEQKEKLMKLKKENEMKLAEIKLSKAQEDQKQKKEEADLVFKAWKKKKDEELRDRTRKQKQKTKKELMNKGQSEEMKKLDAAAAFNAWKSQKLLEFQEKEKESLEKKELEVSLREQEKSERDKEALKAYELWLECKEQYDARYDWRSQLESKPPWSPPGRIT